MMMALVAFASSASVACPPSVDDLPSYKVVDESPSFVADYTVTNASADVVGYVVSQASESSFSGVYSAVSTGTRSCSINYPSGLKRAVNKKGTIKYNSPQGMIVYYNYPSRGDSNRKLRKSK